MCNIRATKDQDWRAEHPPSDQVVQLRRGAFLSFSCFVGDRQNKFCNLPTSHTYKPTYKWFQATYDYEGDADLLRSGMHRERETGARTSPRPAVRQRDTFDRLGS
jgi:hypothetical protein